jgi:acetyl esterase
MTPQQARAAYEQGATVLEIAKPQLARVESFSIAARDGFDMPVRLYAPSTASLPVLLYLHGGGFTVGSIATHDTLCRRISQLAGCAVLSLDYRLAPEFTFPYAHNDAWDALAWLAQNGAAYGLDSTRIALGGDSAGGTLATVCALQARDAGLPLVLQLLFYPGVTSYQKTASHALFGHGFLLEQAHIQYFFQHYAPQPAQREDWRFAPLDGLLPNGQTVDYAGVAPVWMGLAECDPLVDEGLQYADALRMHGVAVDLEIYRGVVHEFIKMGRAIKQAEQAHFDAAHALKTAFAAA